MTSLSDGLGPQKDPNSGRTRVESGPAGTHRPTTRRGSAIAQPSVPRAQAGDGGRRRPIAIDAGDIDAGETLPGMILSSGEADLSVETQQISDNSGSLRVGDGFGQPSAGFNVIVIVT